jgi:lipopolysaccharide export system protein LptA
MMEGSHQTRLLGSMLSSLVFCLAFPALAEKADRDKPTIIDSQKLDHDEQRQVTTFTGNVVLTKGTIVMRGDLMLLWKDEAGNNYGTVTGNPARFRQKRDGVNEFMNGEAQRLVYNGKDEIVTLIDDATLRRLEGDLVRDQIAGDEVIYDSITEQYRAESSRSQQRSRLVQSPTKRE